MSICTWSERWLVVHRAQAHDNPVVSRSDNVVYVYTGMQHPRHYLQCRNVDVVLKRREEQGALMRFNLVSRTHVRDSNDSRVVGTIECKAPLHVFEWLRDVLADDFGRGQGPRIDPVSGRAAIPPWAQRTASGQRVQRPPAPGHLATQRSQTVAARQGGAEAVPAPVPPRSSSLGARRAPQGAQQQQLSPQVQAFDEVLAARGEAAALAQFGPDVARQHAEAQRRAYEAAFAAAQANRPQSQPARTNPGGAAVPYGVHTHAASASASVAPAPAPVATPGAPAYPPLNSFITQGGPQSSSTSSVSVPQQPPAAHTPSPAAASSGNASGATSAEPEGWDLPEDAEEPPSHLCCVLTMDLLVDPVFLSDGHTYERSAIEQWLKDHNTSPKTNLPLPDNRLVPNHALRGQVMDWVEAQQRAAKLAAEKRAAEQKEQESVAVLPQHSDEATQENAAEAGDEDPSMSYLRLANAGPSGQPIFETLPESEIEAEATAPPAPENIDTFDEVEIVAPPMAMGATEAAASHSRVEPESGVSEATSELSSGLEAMGGGTFVHFDEDEDLEQANTEAESHTNTSDFNPFLHMPDAPSHELLSHASQAASERRSDDVML